MDPRILAVLHLLRKALDDPNTDSSFQFTLDTYLGA
jgi:hypothetical protein